MIKYMEIIEKIKDFKEDFINEFNEKISIPMILSNASSTFKEENGNIIIVKDNIEIILDIETRRAFTEIIVILKDIDKELYNKINYKYIDFFEKFKDINYKFYIENNFENLDFKILTYKILIMFNLKFWCNDDLERKKYLESLDTIKDNQFEVQIDEEFKVELDDENSIESESVDLIKNNWWINILNKIRKIKKGIQK